MDEKKFIDLKHKLVDYKNFSMVLLFVSAFLSIGAVIPFQGRTDHDQIVLSLAGVVFLLASMFFYARVLKIKERIQNEKV